MDILIYIGTSIFIAIITALFTARLAFNSFYKQEIWLRKEKEYSQLIEELCALKAYYNTELDSIIFDWGNSEDDSLRRDAYKRARAKFDLIRAGSGLLLSPNVLNVLDKINSEFYNTSMIHDSYIDYIDSLLSVLKVSIIEIKEIALKDLKIKKV